MNHYLLSALLFTVSIQVFAQQRFNDQGFEVTKADLSTNYFEADTTANALVIYEVGNSYVDKNTFLLKTEIKRKIKILNKDGFTKAQHEVVLYDNDKGKKESLDDVKATVYNLNNSRVETSLLNKNEIFKVPEGDHHIRMKFAFPNIKEGSVIIYSYTITSPFMFNYHGWSFQSDIPKLYSEYNASIPGNWDYNIKLVGGQQLIENTAVLKKNCLSAGNGGKADCSEYHYVMKNVPAFIDEKYMTTRSNYLARIEYELKTFRGFDGSRDHITKSWKDTDIELKKEQNIGRQLGKAGYLKDILDESILSEPDHLERAKKVYRFVQNNYAWNGEYHIFKGISVKNLVKEKTGSVSEINILLHNLMLEANIEVKPIIMSTRENGLPTQLFPVISEFNYIITMVKIDGNDYMLDATDKFLPFGVLPFRCLNQYGRLLDFENGSKWIDIKPRSENILSYRSVLELSDDTELLGHIDVLSTGYKAITSTKNYISLEGKYLDTYESDLPDIDFLSHTLQSDINSTEEYKERFEISYSAQEAGSNLYINPFVFMFFESNPLKLQTRSYPIDFGYPDIYSYSIQLKLKEGYEVLEIPKSNSLALPDGKGTLIFNTTSQENAIIMLLKLNFNEAIYGSEYYAALKQFFSEIVEIQKNSLIVLKKRS